MSDIPDDIMIAAELVLDQTAWKMVPVNDWDDAVKIIARTILAERMDARRVALEEAAKVAETGRFNGWFQTQGDRRRAEDIAHRIRALQSEERPTDRTQLRPIFDDAEGRN